MILHGNHSVLYPYCDRQSSMLAEGGIYHSVKDSDELLRYDFYETWNTPHYFEKATGYLSVDSTRYVDGAGLEQFTVVLLSDGLWITDLFQQFHEAAAIFNIVGIHNLILGLDAVVVIHNRQMRLD